MRPSRRSDSTALAETNRVCRSDVDFDAPMIAMRAISAVTGSRRESPWEAYFSVTPSNAVLTFRVPPRPVRSMTATSTSFSRRRPMINLQGATSTKLSKRRLAGGRRRRADELSTSHFDKIIEISGTEWCVFRQEHRKNWLHPGKGPSNRPVDFDQIIEKAT